MRITSWISAAATFLVLCAALTYFFGARQPSSPLLGRAGTPPAASVGQPTPVSQNRSQEEMIVQSVGSETSEDRLPSLQEARSVQTTEPVDPATGRQAAQVRIKQDASGKTLETDYLNQAAQVIQALRETENGQLRTDRTLDAAGNVIRERTFQNGFLKSESSGPGQTHVGEAASKLADPSGAGAR